MCDDWKSDYRKCEGWTFGKFRQLEIDHDVYLMAFCTNGRSEILRKGRILKRRDGFLRWIGDRHLWCCSTERKPDILYVTLFDPDPKGSSTGLTDAAVISKIE